MASPTPLDRAAHHAARIAAYDPFQRAEHVSLAQSGSNAAFLAPCAPRHRPARVIAIGDVL